MTKTCPKDGCIYDDYIEDPDQTTRTPRWIRVDCPVCELREQMLEHFQLKAGKGAPG